MAGPVRVDLNVHWAQDLVTSPVSAHRRASSRPYRRSRWEKRAVRAALASAETWVCASARQDLHYRTNVLQSAMVCSQIAWSNGCSYAETAVWGSRGAERDEELEVCASSWDYLESRPWRRFAREPEGRSLLGSLFPIQTAAATVCVLVTFPMSRSLSSKEWLARCCALHRLNFC